MPAKKTKKTRKVDNPLAGLNMSPELEVPEPRPSNGHGEEDPMSIFKRVQPEDPDLRVVTRPGEAIDLLTQLEDRLKDPLQKLRFYAELIGSRRLMRLVIMDMRMSNSLGKDQTKRWNTRWQEVRQAQAQAQAQGTTLANAEQEGPLQ